MCTVGASKLLQSVSDVHREPKRRTHEAKKMFIFNIGHRHTFWLHDASNHRLVTYRRVEQMIQLGAAIAQRIHLRLPFCGPGFYPKHTIYASSIYSQIFYCICRRVEKRMKINKKEARFGPFKKPNDSIDEK